MNYILFTTAAYVCELLLIISCSMKTFIYFVLNETNSTVNSFVKLDKKVR